MQRYCMIVLLVIPVVCGIGKATVYQVPGDFATIQEALDACTDHDVVEVEPATYRESLVWPDAEAVTLRSSVQGTMVSVRPPGPGHEQSLLTKLSAPVYTVILENLDFAGAVHAPGAGLHIENANLIMRHCASRNHRFRDLEMNLGLALYCVNCNLAIDECEFSGNEYEAPTPAIEVTGLAVYLENCTGYFMHCTFSDNAFTYSVDIVHSLCNVDYYHNRFVNNRNEGSDNYRTCLSAGAGTVVISGNVFDGNRANHGALMTHGMMARVENNLFNNNGVGVPEARSFKPGATVNRICFNTFADNSVYSIGDPGLHSTVESNIIMAPMAGDWSREDRLNYNLYGFDDPESYPFAYGPFDIFGDPLFVTGPGGEYYLSQISAGQGMDSPCVDAGNPNDHPPAGTTRSDYGPDQGRPDIGFHYPVTGPAPPCSNPGVTIRMPAVHYHAGDRFSTSLELCNALPVTRPGNVYMALMVAGTVFYWPAFGHDLDAFSDDFNPGITEITIIPEFIWPSGSAGATGSALWVSVFTDINDRVIGQMDLAEFTFDY